MAMQVRAFRHALKKIAKLQRIGANALELCAARCSVVVSAAPARLGRPAAVALSNRTADKILQAAMQRTTIPPPVQSEFKDCSP
jgi:hypothetical protein